MGIRENILETYGGKLRLRVCGILLEEGALLMVKHKHLGSKGVLWAPPGGRVVFNQSLELNLIV